MSFVVPIKTGNQNPDMPHKAFMDLMVIDYQPVVNNTHQKSVLGHILLNDDLKDFIKDAVKPLRVFEDPEDTENEDRIKKYALDLDKADKYLDGGSMHDIYNQWAATGVMVEPIDLRNVTNPLKIFKHSSKLDPSFFVLDRNVHTSGTFTIGTGGGDDFASHVATAADAGTFVGAVEYQLNSAGVIETADASWTNDGGGQNVTWVNNSAHSGDPTAGYILQINHTGTYGIRITMSGSPNVDFGGYSFKNLGNLGGTASQLYMGNTGIILAHDLFIDGNVTNTGGFRCAVAAGAVVRLCNFMIRDCDGNDGIIMGLDNCTIENGLITNTDGDGLDNNSKTTTIKSVACFGNTVDFANLTNATLSGTASDDATSPDNPSLTPSTEMELDDTLSNYGLPKIGGICDTNGVAPTYCANDMNGVAYASYPSNRPIGGKILVPEAGVFAPIISRKGIHSGIHGGVICNG